MPLIIREHFKFLMGFMSSWFYPLFPFVEVLKCVSTSGVTKEKIRTKNKGLLHNLKLFLLALYFREKITEIQHNTFVTL